MPEWHAESDKMNATMLILTLITWVTMPIVQASTSVCIKMSPYAQVCAALSISNSTDDRFQKFELSFPQVASFFRYNHHSKYQVSGGSRERYSPNEICEMFGEKVLTDGNNFSLDHSSEEPAVETWAHQLHETHIGHSASFFSRLIDRLTPSTYYAYHIVKLRCKARNENSGTEE